MTAVELLLLQRKVFFEGTEMVIAGIKPEMFDTRPFPHLMSFGEQVDHIASVEAELLGETAQALKSEENGLRFGESSDLSSAIDQWRMIHRAGDDFIGSLDDNQLEFRFLTVSHVHISVADMINNVLEHEIHHRGELIAYFRLINQEPPRRWSD